MNNLSQMQKESAVEHSKALTMGTDISIRAREGIELMENIQLGLSALARVAHEQDIAIHGVYSTIKGIGAYIQSMDTQVVNVSHSLGVMSVLVKNMNEDHQTHAALLERSQASALKLEETLHVATNLVTSLGGLLHHFSRSFSFLSRNSTRAAVGAGMTAGSVSYFRRWSFVKGGLLASK
jgi:hypothetical protein